MAALETKVDTYEREISRLKRALDRSDDYIEELKRQHGQSRNMLSFDDMTSKMTERAIRNGTHENSFATQSKSPQDMESPLLSLQNSRIDDLATVALATRNSTYSDSISRGVDMTLQCQLQRSYNVSSSASEKDANNETATHRSIFEDPSKFPACAKLIELTKVRRDFVEPQPGEVMPLDAVGRLVDQISNHSNSPNHQCDLDENPIPKGKTSERTQSRSLARSLESIQNKLSASGNATTESYCRVSSPSSSFGGFAEASYSEQADKGSLSADSQTGSPDNQQFPRIPVQTSLVASDSQTYPSSVILSNDKFGPKRIKVEETD